MSSPQHSVEETTIGNKLQIDSELSEYYFI